MPIEITVPRLGWSMEEGLFSGWLKQNGDTVSAGEPLFAVESDKVTMEVESLDSGILFIPSDAPLPEAIVRVGQRLGFLLAAGEAAPETAADLAPPAAALTAQPEAQATTAPEPREGRIAVTPRARRVASELGVDTASLKGTGRGGRIREADVRAAAVSTSAPITTLRAGLPYSLQRVVDRCLQKKSADRYPTMREVVTELKVVRRDLESGVSGGQPFVDRARSWARGLTARGAIWIAVGGFAAGAFLVGIATSRGRFDVGPIVFLLLTGAIFYRKFRNRRVDAVAKFGKRAAKLSEVRLVTANGSNILVVVHHPTAKTYVKLNSLLARANSGLFHGEPFTLSVRENVSQEERVTLLSSPGLQYAAD